MPIIGTLPNNIQNGQTVDANPVMADFNFIVNQVNANANPAGTLTAPAGTAMLFQQAAAPTGWVAQTGTQFQDAFLRSVIPANFTGTAGASGATVLISGSATVDSHTLSVAEMPSHSHTDSGHTHTQVAHQHGTNDATNFLTTGNTFGNFTGGANSLGFVQFTNTLAPAINSSTANLQNTGGGTGHSHTLTNFNFKYVDHIVAVKS